MADDFSELFKEDLQEDEKILWAGQPEPSVYLTRADTVLIPISLWLGLYTLRSGMLLLGRLFIPGYSVRSILISMVVGGLFVLVGIYLMLGRFLYKIWRKRRTYYAVTNKRVLVLARLNGRRLQEQPITEIPALQKSVRRDGIGTITFGYSPFAASWCGNTGMNCLAGFDRADLIAFHDIKGANEVYDLVEGLRNG